MAEYIEGKRAVLEAFKTNVPATCLYVAEGSHGDKNVSELVKRAHKMGLSVKQVKRDQLDKRSERGSHQGVMLETKPFEYCSAQALDVYKRQPYGCCWCNAYFGHVAAYRCHGIDKLASIDNE